MAEAIWFYAKNDEQKGPVTPAQLKALATSGELLPTDLVWKEGLSDWSPASDVKGLFVAAPTAPAPAPSPPVESPPPAPTPAPSPPTTPTPVTTSPAVVPTPPPAATTSLDPIPPASGSRWANPPPPPPVVPAAEPVPTPVPAASKRFTRETRPGVKSLTKAFVALGLLLVFGVRGCETLSERYAARLVAKAEILPAQFDADWEARKQAIAVRRDNITEQGLQRDVEIEKLQTELSQLNTKLQTERERLAKDHWQALQSAARSATASHTIWNFWRELLFLPAAVLLALGLFRLGLGSDAPDRWLCWGLLLLLAYALLIR